MTVPSLCTNGKPGSDDSSCHSTVVEPWAATGTRHSAYTAPWRSMTWAPGAVSVARPDWPNVQVYEPSPVGRGIGGSSTRTLARTADIGVASGLTMSSRGMVRASGAALFTTMRSRSPSAVRVRSRDQTIAGSAPRSGVRATVS